MDQNAVDMDVPEEVNRPGVEVDVAPGKFIIYL
jgi:hypothetical protein